MKRILSGIMTVFILLISFNVYATNFDATQVYDSVIVVYTKTGVGSGFAIKENIIITNAHVVGTAKNVQINMYNGESVKGTVVKLNNEKDLALVKVKKKFKPLPLSTEKISIGQEVYAIGAPKDMPYTMTKGIISALDRKVGNNVYTQIDASVNSGNSGGPLVDNDGKVIGVITLKASDAEGIGFAIQIKDINNFIKDIDDSTVTEEEEEDYELEDEEPEVSGKERMLARQNNTLKIVLCVSVLANIVLVLLLVYASSRNNTPKRKDEFDFEIEIEE